MNKNIPIEMTSDILERRIKNNTRQAKVRMCETKQDRIFRLQKLRYAAKTRRARETVQQKNERISKIKVTQKRQRESMNNQSNSSSNLSNARKEELWRHVNQNLEPKDIKTFVDMDILAECYERDLKKFKKNTIGISYSEICSVCGLLLEDESSMYDVKNDIFLPLRRVSNTNDEIYWNHYGSFKSGSALVCQTCLKTLKKKTNNIPRFCRANIPIPDPVDQLKGLSFIELMLISPILPMVFVWRYKTFGQYQSKGQCVAFCNKVQEVAKVLPRTLAEIFVNVKDIYGHADITIRVKTLREALSYLKLNHPGYVNIQIQENNFSMITKDLNVSQEEVSKTDGSDRGSRVSAAQMVRDAGQNQVVEEDFAQVALSTPICVEAAASKEEISKTIKHLFKSLSQKDNQCYSNLSVINGWSLMFPCLLWNGKGGPDSFVCNKISLREWVNYVVKVPSLDFRRNIIFISYANIVLRRKRITGLTTHKPIGSSIQQAVKELVQISHSSHPSSVPDCTLNSLSKQIGAYVDELPGSLSDMRKFRNDILSMKKKTGPPTFFLTLSSADSMWPEGFIAAKNNEITIEQARKLSGAEGADIMAQNPVAMTEVWKRRVNAFLNLVIKGESKPLGEITQYVRKAEWQGRLSEHAHFLFWTKDGIPPLILREDGELNDNQTHITSKAETLASAKIHFYSETNLKGNDSGESPDTEYIKEQQELNSCEKQSISSLNKEMKILPKEKIFKSITEEPVSFQGYFLTGKPRRSLNKLVTSVNLHICSAYCTKNGTSSCKSRFPFKIRKDTIVKQIIDKNLNKSFRIHRQRNHSRINPYNVPIINVWRADMDLTVLCGSAFASIVYVTYYTSKLDKSSNIRDVIQKITKMDDITKPKTVLRKILINMDTCRATGLPEASSNIFSSSTQVHIS